MRSAVRSHREAIRFSSRDLRRGTLRRRPRSHRLTLITARRRVDLLCFRPRQRRRRVCVRSATRVYRLIAIRSGLRRGKAGTQLSRSRSHFLLVGGVQKAVEGRFRYQRTATSLTSNRHPDRPRVGKSNRSASGARQSCRDVHVAAVGGRFYVRRPTFWRSRPARSRTVRPNANCGNRPTNREPGGQSPVVTVHLHSSPSPLWSVRSGVRLVPVDDLAAGRLPHAGM
jgi:hypothetical protein